MRRYSCEEHKRDRTDFHFCAECFEKQLKIDRLKEENAQLKAQLRYRTKKDNQEFFGSSTPSSKKYIKANSKEENKNKQGGAKVGHKGNGRKTFTEEEADEVVNLRVEERECPNCGGKLESKEIEERSIVEAIISEARKILYKYQIKKCRCCNTTIENKPLVLPRNKYGNQLITDSAVKHYLYGIPLKRIEDMWGENVVAGNLIKTFHRLADFWKPAIKKLEEDFRAENTKHADETGWRTDGDNGYSWLFCSNNTSIFKFENNRSAKVPAEVLGKEKIPGVLVVDRYRGYNKAPCEIQYCYAHLLRDVKDLEKDFPKSKEITRFVKEFAPLLADAMGLRTEKISDKKYYKKAQERQDKIMALARAPAKHCGIQKYQDIFIEKEHRLFHWVKDRKVPAENNRAERELRPTVIARKVSFGSQSTKGARTRSILMTILHTAAKRLTDEPLHTWFHETLIAFIENPNIDPYLLLPEIPN